MTLVQTIEKRPLIQVATYAVQDHPDLETALKEKACVITTVKSDEEARAILQGIRIIEMIQEQGVMFGVGTIVYDTENTFDIIRDDRGDE